MLSKPELFNEASTPSKAPVLKAYVQPTLGHGLRIWWAYYWPTSLVSLVLIIVLTIALRKAWENGTFSTYVVLWSSRILPYVVAYGISMVTIRYVLGRTFRSFRVALLPRDGSSTTPLPRSFRRTIRVWWAFSWRLIVFSLIVRFAGGVALGFTVGILSSMGRVMAILAPLLLQIAIDGAVGLFVIYSAILDEQFADFRVALLPRDPSLNAVPAAANEGSIAL